MNTSRMECFNLTNHFLIAMPTLQDPNFVGTVTYICAHSVDGAMGIVVNRPLEFDLGDVFEQMEIGTSDPQIRAQRVYLGGPVQTDRGFVIHRPARAWNSTMEITAEVAVSTSRDILAAIAAGEGPDRKSVV